MPEVSNPTLYVRLRKRIRLPQGAAIYLGSVAQIVAPPEYERDLQHLPLHSPKEQDGNLILIDMLLIVEKVKAIFPFMQIEHFGEPHTLVEVYKEIKRPHLIVIALVCFLLFIGSGLAIMNFHADVSMLTVHRRIYQLLTGKWVDHPLLLQIPYSIGIGIGMVVFFNHLFKKKFNEEPSPLEVEMFMYQESVNHYVITEEYGKLHDKVHEEKAVNKAGAP
ncbi:stage V sporulation protein AA [Paenibacillus hamazuiensis]|uniref:stage V sporulation protein AA n=1 Tax=Paenibacillus hamazuiensis TaxID=2936508 RepID=UPI0020103664|nr:stage V sporulation protein AA [Paenibacillus hamazuiensis]